MKKHHVRILSVLIAVIMLIGVLSLTALADEANVEVTSWGELQSAQSAAEGSTVVVSGKIEMEAPVAFQNVVTLQLTDTAELTYTSDANSRVELITLQGGSELAMAAGSSVTMTGTGTQNTSRDWRAIYSNGNLSVTEFAGSITVENARGRGLYANNDLAFECPMAGTITMQNPNGENQYVCGIASYQGNITFQQGITKDGHIQAYFGGGKNTFGIIAQAGSVTILGDMAGEIDVQAGVSHNAFGIYAAQGDVTVTGDISGALYARAGSGSGYGIYASNDIAVAAISGSVTGDCYNKVMANSQSGAGALYAGGSIYGSKAEAEVKPIELTGTLSSTVGRSGAFTVQATEDVYIDLGSSAAIEAQSSYGAAWTELEGSYTGMEDNWGGTAVCVIANGDINLTGADENCTAISQNEDREPVDAAGPLVATGNKDSVTRIDNFLCYVSLATLGDSYKQEAEKLNGQLTDADKALIDGYDEIAEDLFAETVSTKDALIEALKAAQNGDIIVLGADITLDANGLPGAAISGKKLTINGNGKTLTFAKSGSLTNGVFGNDVNALYADTDLTVKNLTIKNTGAQGGYAAILGYNAHGAKVTFEGCKFEGLNAAVYVNAINAEPEKGGVTIEITNSEYVNTPYGYAIDESAGSYLLTDVVFEDNTGLSGSDEVASNVVYATVGGYKKVFSTIQAAVDAADNNSVVEVMPGTYDGNVLFGGKSLTIQAHYPAYKDGVKEADDEKLSKFTGTFNTYNGTTDASFAVDQKVVIEGFAFSGDGLKVGNNNYNTVGNLEVRYCTMEFGKNLTKQENYNLYNYFVKLSGNAGAPYASVTVEDNYISGTPDNLVTPIQLWDVDKAIVRNNVLNLKNAEDHQAINISKMAADAEVEVSGNTINGAGGGIYVTTWLLDGETDNATAKFTGSIAVENNALQCVDSDLEPIFIGYEDVDNVPYGLLGGSIELDNNTNNGKNVAATVVFGPKGTDEDYFVVLVKDGKDLVAQAVVEDGARYTLPSKPTKKGYTFLGWKSSADREVYKAGSSVKIYEDTTFTAQWMSNWEIVDDIAGAAGSGKEFFTDVKGSAWYYDAVKFVYDNGFMDGVGDNKFNPNGTLTRAMIAQVLYNLEGETSSYPTVFDDVAKSAWYADAVNWAAASGIVEGKGNNKFDPNAAITRQEMAAILYRYSELKGYDVSDVDSLSSFTDAGKVASWAKEPMGWAVENYVINGKGNGTLDPTGTATRAEVAQILMNLCNNVL